MDPTPLPIELAAYFTPADLARGELRQLWGHVFGWSELAVDLVLLLGATFGGLGRRAFATCERLAARVPPGGVSRVLGEGWLAGALFLGLFALVRGGVSLPFTLGGLAVGHALGTSHEPWTSLLRREVVETLVVAAGFAVLGASLGAVRRRFPRRWWLATGLVGALALVVDAAAEPLWLRLDYTVAPLADGTVRTRIEALSRQLAVPAGNILTIDSSRYGTRANAFVMGLGPTQALVLTDTLVALGAEAAAGAAAHELGHRHPQRVPLRLAMAALGLVVFLWLVERALAWALSRGARSEAHAVPFVLVCATAAQLALWPVRATRQLAEEREADRVELSVRSDYGAYVNEQVALVRANAAHPRPSGVDAWLADHPSAAERIGLALAFEARRRR